MLVRLVESKLQTKFLIIKDNVAVNGQDLFIAFLMNCESDNAVKRINLICYENPPAFYLPENKHTVKEIISYNYFSDPCAWNSKSTPNTDLSVFTSDCKSLKETAFFIDSLSLLIHYHGFCSAYRNLGLLKNYSEKLICIFHEDLFSSEEIEELSFLATAFIELQDFSVKKNCEEKFINIIYKKPGGKILNQKEFFFIDSQFNISSKTNERKTSVLGKSNKDVEPLSTFKLGLHMSEGERKAKKELILPFLKIKGQNHSGEIMYQAEANECEDDPDNDLDI